MALEVALLFALPVHATLARDQRPLLIGLILPPLARVVSLALPVTPLSSTASYGLTGLPLLVGVAAVICELRLPRERLGLCIRNLPLQLAIGLVGLEVGVLQSLIVHPTVAVKDHVGPERLILLAGAGLLDELIFRGILQAAASAVLGRWGLLYTSAVYAALQLGYLSPLHTCLAFVTGLVFALLVSRTGSLLGVGLAHALVNVTPYLILPLLAMPPLG
jgi:uncharacterized protein